MPLIDLTTNLKSLKFGNDQRGGGSSNQPYIKRDIPGNDDSFEDQINGDLPVRSGPDFLLRNGFLAPVDAARDVSRLTQMFFDFKSPNGPLFIAKENLLSRTAVKTEAASSPAGIIGYGGGAVNAGIYTPLSTIAQAGVGFAGMHLNLLGVNPASPLGPDVSLLSQAQGGLVRYESVVEFNNREENNTAPMEMEKSRFVRNPEFQYTLNMLQGDNPPPMFLLEEYTETVGGFNNRLIKTWFDKQDQKNIDDTLLEYGGGPGSVLGIGKTKIKFASQRTGVNNPLFDTDPSYFFGTQHPIYRGRDTLKSAGLYKFTSGFRAGTYSVSHIGASYVAATSANTLSTEDQTQLINDTQQGDVYKRIAINAANSTFKNQSLVDVGFFPEGADGQQNFAVFLRPSPVYQVNKIFFDNSISDIYNGITLGAINLRQDSYGTEQYLTEGSGDLKFNWRPSVYSDDSLTARADLDTYQVGNSKNGYTSFIDFGGDISGSSLVAGTNDGGLGVVPYTKGASAIYSTLASGSYDKEDNFNFINYNDNQRVNTYNFSVYASQGGVSASFDMNAPLQKANGSITMTQGELLEQTPISQGGTLQDFRKTLIDSGSITTSTIMSSAPDYATKRKESRVNLGDPGSKAGKNVFNYSTSTTILDKINGSDLYEAAAATHSGDKNDLCKFSIGIMKNDSSGNGVFMNFRAFLDSFNDAYTANWDSVKYVGRGDEFYNYNGFNREISMGWTVMAQSKAELIPMYKKLNYLASSLAPDYSSGGFMRGSLARLTVGGYLYNQLGIIKSITYDIPNDSTWEIAINDEAGFDDTVKELPHMIKVTGFAFTPIQEFLPSKAKSITNQKQRYIALSNGRNNNYS